MLQISIASLSRAQGDCVASMATSIAYNRFLHSGLRSGFFSITVQSTHALIELLSTGCFVVIVVVASTLPSMSTCCCNRFSSVLSVVHTETNSYSRVSIETRRSDRVKKSARLDHLFSAESVQTKCCLPPKHRCFLLNHSQDALRTDWLCLCASISATNFVAAIEQ